jgi:hypothetical protein
MPRKIVREEIDELLACAVARQPKILSASAARRVSDRPRFAS